MMSLARIGSLGVREVTRHSALVSKTFATSIVALPLPSTGIPRIGEYTEKVMPGLDRRRFGPDRYTPLRRRERSAQRCRPSPAEPIRRSPEGLNCASWPCSSSARFLSVLRAFSASSLALRAASSSLAMSSRSLVRAACSSSSLALASLRNCSLCLVRSSNCLVNLAISSSKASDLAFRSSRALFELLRQVVALRSSACPLLPPSSGTGCRGLFSMSATGCVGRDIRRLRRRHRRLPSCGSMSMADLTCCHPLGPACR